MKQEKPKSGKKWIWLVAGLVLVLAIVGVVLAMVLGGGSAQTSNIPMEGRSDLYWNIDRLPHNISRCQLANSNILNIFKDMNSILQTGYLVAGEIDLCDITGNQF